MELLIKKKKGGKKGKEGNAVWVDRGKKRFKSDRIKEGILIAGRREGLEEKDRYVYLRGK